MTYVSESKKLGLGKDRGSQRLAMAWEMIWKWPETGARRANGGLITTHEARSGPGFLLHGCN